MKFAMQVSITKHKNLVICPRFIYFKFTNVLRGGSCYSLSKHHNGESLITKNVLLKT